MTMAFAHKIITSKKDVLTELRNNLQTMVDEANEVLQLTTSWLTNEEGRDVTFTELSKMIEDKIVFLSNTSSVGCEEATGGTESAATRRLPSTSTFTDQLPLSARYDQVSVVPEELKTVMNQVKVMQDAMSFLSTSSDKLSEKQLTMEKCLDSLAEKYSTVEHTKIKEIEIELKSISGKQKTETSKQDERMTNVENKIQEMKKLQTWLDDKLEVEQTKIKNKSKENNKFQKQFTQDLKEVMGNIQELNIRISALENQTVNNTQLEVLEKKVEFLESSSEDISIKFEEHTLSFNEFTRKTAEDFKNVPFFEGRTFEKLHKFEEKILALEMEWNQTSQEAKKLSEEAKKLSQEAKKLCQDVEIKYQMVCQIVADKLVPLERLRDVFNEKMDIRDNNITKLGSFDEKIADLLLRFSQLEIQIQRQAAPVGNGFNFNRNTDTKTSCSCGQWF